MRKKFSCAVMAAVLSLGVYSPSANAAVRIDIENTAIPQERAARPNYSGISLSVPEFGKFIGGESDDIFPVAHYSPVERDISLNGETAFPSSFDLRDQGKMTSVKNQLDYGLKAKAAMDAGALVSDDIVIGILKERIAEDDCKNGFILDGFPRTVPQAEALDAMGIKIDKVIEIFVPDETIKQRVSGRRVCQGCGASYHVQYKPTKVEGVCDKCGDKTIVRKDDQPEVVLDRLATYHEKTAPLKDYYEKQGKLVTVEGQEEVADTSKLTLAAVGVEK